MNHSAPWRRCWMSSLVRWGCWFALVSMACRDRPERSVGVVDGFQRVTPSHPQRHHHSPPHPHPHATCTTGSGSSSTCTRKTNPMMVRQPVRVPVVQARLRDRFRVRVRAPVSCAANHNDAVTTTATPSAPSSSNINGDDTTSGTTSVESDSTAATPAVPESVPFWRVLWRFTRPHTLVGSALAIPALHLLAAPPSLDTFRSIATLTNMMISIAYATVPALLMNLYITGLNQITDVDIDKINKPNLPMAAGILTRRDAILTCLVALTASLYMGTYGPAKYSTQGLQVALWGSGILGTVYSLEPFRLKRYPLFAALCIVAVRGAIINASFFAHAMAAVFHQPSATVVSCLINDPRCLFSSIFFGIFGIVIALMKDVPDVLGDKSSSIRTFSVRIGPERIFCFSRRLLMGLFYVCAAGFVQRAVTATTSLLAVCRYTIAIACLVAARSARQQSKVVDPTNPTQVYGYYMHLWKIFYVSYLMLPLAR